MKTVFSPTIKQLLVAGIIVLKCSMTLASSNFEALNDFEKFRRLSFIVRGRAPDFSEMAQFRQLESSARNQYFEQMADQYIDSEDFNLTMTKFLSDLFRVARPRQEMGYNSSLTSLHMRFHELAAQNKPWDDLLLSTQIMTSLEDLKNSRGLPSFYSAIISPDQTEKLRKYVEEAYLEKLKDFINLKNKDNLNSSAFSRIMDTTSTHLAGTLTDPSFLARHPTTPMNQNRKRAAAIFRIFLCDDMKAVILPDANAEKELELAALDDGLEARKLVSSTPSIVKMHAGEEKCSSCHYKLDPLAKAYVGISSRISPRTVPGELTFKRKNGELARIPYRNMQDLAKAIVDQPEYLSCQVQHFWDLFVGKDIPLSASTKDELVSQFNQMERRPKTFAKYLVRRPEFYRFPRFDMDSIGFNQVSGILKNCKSCHDKETLAPQVDQVPFKVFGGSDEHQKIVEQIIEDLDLLGNGSQAKMPPKSAGWTLDPRERVLLTAWLAGGAKTLAKNESRLDTVENSLQVTWTNPQLQSSLRQKLSSEMAEISLFPTYDYTAKRRVDPDQILSTIRALQMELDLQKSNLFSRPEFSFRNLESGKVMSNPSSSYGKSVADMASNFMSPYGSKAIQKLETLGLKIPQLACDGDSNSKECWEKALTDVDLNMKLLLELNLALFGFAPEKGSPLYNRYENYIRRHR